MSILNRIGRAVQANLNALFDSAEDPDKVIAQTLRDMQEGIRDAKRDLVQTLGSAKRLAEEAEGQRAEATRWEERAALALRADDEELARQALAQKLSAARKADQTTASANQHRAAANELEAAIEKLEERVRDLDARKGTLAAQVRTARTRSGSPAASPTASSDLDRMTSRIDAMEAEIEAANVLDDPKRAELEARFNALEAGRAATDVEDQLALLKRRLDDSEAS